MITILLLLALHAPKATAMTLFKAHYIAVEGTDPEYGQGAIERNEMRHHPLPQLRWLILTDEPTTAPELQARLNAAVDPKNGSFVIDAPSADEEEQVRSGKIEFQR
ncbi:MAG: hypothetical protein QOK37_3842 [Thermoanaerobaculia bacterium]|jgi:hypothetical protein|nr:hypothetical protein [Thermoanaerobaculia bacterium]